MQCGMRRALASLQARGVASAALASLQARGVASAAAPTRAAYPYIARLQTRWQDNDCFGHVNNAVYYQLMDDAVNGQLHEHGVPLDARRFVVESSCRFIRPFSYPTPADVALRVKRLGNTSAVYDIAIFAGGDGGAADEPAAVGHWVHVYVDGATGKPSPPPPSARKALTALLVPGEPS